jgi:hypothetical protein
LPIWNTRPPETGTGATEPSSTSPSDSWRQSRGAQNAIRRRRVERRMTLFWYAKPLPPPLPVLTSSVPDWAAIPPGDQMPASVAGFR